MAITVFASAGDAVRHRAWSAPALIKIASFGLYLVAHVYYPLS